MSVILAVLFFISTLVLGLLLKKSKDALTAQRAELASTRHRSKRELEELKAEHHKAIDRHTRHASQNLEGAHLSLATDLFEGIDALEMAIQNAHDHPNTTKQDLLDGIVMVNRSLTRALAKHGVTPIAPLTAQDAFDPALHEAIGVLQDDTLPPHTVGELLRTGWRHTTKTLRPAMVRTTQTSAALTAPESEEPVALAENGHEEPVALDFSPPEPDDSDELRELVEEPATVSERS